MLDANSIREQYEYRQLVLRLRRILAESLAPRTTVLVVSRGDDELLQVTARRVWHFPRAENGAYAGHYPSDSGAAIRELEHWRSKGADYLVFPATAFWWLEFYETFRIHLEKHYTRTVLESKTCLVFDIRKRQIEEHETITEVTIESRRNGKNDLPSQPHSEPRRLPRLASFSGHLLLDGHGREILTSHARRDKHPYFGNWPYNVGDQFVSLAIAKHLRFEEFYSIDPGASKADFEVINRECDVFVIRGSNFIYPGFFAKYFTPGLLRKIKIPIVYIGAGIQFKLGERPSLLPADYESLRYIHGSCVSCSVRGPIAAELLSQGGISNVRVTGCPTIIWSGRPEIKVRQPSWDNVGWTMTEMHSPLKERQFDFMEVVRCQSGLFTVFAQGGEVVLQEHILCRDGHVTEGRIDEALSPTLRKSIRVVKSPSQLASSVAYHYSDAAPGLRESLLKRSFFSNSVADYLNSLGKLSFVCGTRLHGNVMALCQGVPTLFVLHDERLVEMTQLMRVPSVSICSEKARIDIAQYDWQPFESAYREIYATFVRFFEENGLAHNLKQEPVTTAGCQEVAGSLETIGI